MSLVAPRIGELLVEEGACAASAVREALQNQVIFGGRVGTNLLELEALSEERLASALARRHRCRHVFGPVRPAPEAVTLVPREMADRWDVVPLEAADRSLTILACDPGNLAMLDEIAFAAGRRVIAAVAAQARIWAILRSTYGIVRELRGIELEEEEPAAPRRAEAQVARPDEAGDLMDEAGFDALYGRLHRGDGPPAPAPAPAPARAAVCSRQVRPVRPRLQITVEGAAGVLPDARRACQALLSAREWGQVRYRVVLQSSRHTDGAGAIGPGSGTKRAGAADDGDPGSLPLGPAPNRRTTSTSPGTVRCASAPETSARLDRRGLSRRKRLFARA